MTPFRVVLWLAVMACFVRGLWAFDMGLSAEKTYPVASAICLMGSVLAAIMLYGVELAFSARPMKTAETRLSEKN